jgi:hypothetical protein
MRIAPQYTTNYVLIAELYVAGGVHAKFEGKFRQFLKNGGFGRFSENALIFKYGMRADLNPAPLKLSGLISLEEADGKRAEMRPDPLAHADVCRYVHFWAVPDLRSLDVASIMQASAEDTEYCQLDALVEREFQNFTVRVRWPGALGELVGYEPAGGEELVYVVRHFKSVDLSYYLYVGFPATLPTLTAKGWLSRGVFQHATGLLNTVVELWRPPPETENPQDVASMAKAVRGTPAQPYWDEMQKLSGPGRRELVALYVLGPDGK